MSYTHTSNYSDNPYISYTFYTCDQCEPEISDIYKKQKLIYIRNGYGCRPCRNGNFCNNNLCGVEELFCEQCKTKYKPEYKTVYKYKNKYQI
jgi:hypothetical protein